MSDFKDEVSELYARAGLNSDQPDQYDRIREEDGELVEERITPGGDLEEKTVATNVKAGTPAVYLLRKTHRVLLSLDPDNQLQYHTLENGSEEWDEEAKQISNVTDLNLQSQLAAGYTKTKIHVFYQDTNNDLIDLTTSDFNSWGAAVPLTSAANPVEGTPLLAVEKGPDELCLFYISGDDHVHCLTITDEGSTDHQVPYANVGSSVTRLVARITDDESFIFFVLNKDNTVVQHTTDGKAVLGTLQSNGNLDLANKEECCWLRPRPRRCPIIIWGPHCRRW